MTRFITEHKDFKAPDPATGVVGLRWGVEPMCAVLSEHGIKVSPSTYEEWVEKKTTRRQLRDVEVTGLILALREHNKLNARMGSRKMWIKLRGLAHEVARCTVERPVPSETTGTDVTKKPSRTAARRAERAQSPGHRAAAELVEAGALDGLFAQIDAGELELTGDGGFVPALIKAALERGLQVELSDHLGYDKGAPEASAFANSRNGSTPKTVATQVGDVDLAVPRDREGSFTRGWSLRARGAWAGSTR